MKVVIDTNVLVSALYKPASTPGRIVILALEGAIQLFAPDTVRAELERVLRVKLRYSDSDWDRTLAALSVSWIEAATYQTHLGKAAGAIRDPDDAPVVAVALLLKAVVVSGDAAFHLLRKPVVKTLRPREMTTKGAG